MKSGERIARIFVPEGTMLKTPGPQIFSQSWTVIFLLFPLFLTDLLIEDIILSTTKWKLKMLTSNYKNLFLRKLSRTRFFKKIIKFEFKVQCLTNLKSVLAIGLASNFIQSRIPALIVGGRSWLWVQCNQKDFKIVSYSYFSKYFLYSIQMQWQRWKYYLTQYQLFLQNKIYFSWKFTTKQNRF